MHITQGRKMLEQILRDRFDQWLTTPILKCLCTHSNPSPTHITLFGLLLGIGSSLAIILNSPTTALLLLFASGLADALDGALARHLQQTSSWGTCLDIFCDRVVESSIILALAYTYPHPLLSMLMLASCYLCITAFLVIGLLSTQESTKQFYYSPGLMERPEAFIAFALMILYPSAYVPLAVGFCLLVSFTALKHLYDFYLANTIKSQRDPL